MLAMENKHILFSTTTRDMVIQKNSPGQYEESIMAIITVTMKTTTSTNMLYTMRGVRLPLLSQRTEIT